MSDILDSIEELDDDLDFEEDEEFAGEVVEASGKEEDEDFASYEMEEGEAQEITEAIRASTTATYILLARAHEHKAYKALGYSTWAEYVKEEFEISASRSYQLLHLSDTIAQIEEATPVDTKIKLTEAQARDIKQQLPRITEQLRETTKGMTPEEAEEEVSRMVDEIREQKKLEEKEAAKKQKAADEAEEQARLDGLESQADALLEADRSTSVTDDADEGFIDLAVEGEDTGVELSPEDSMNLYNFFNVLTSITSLPEPDDFITVVPEARAEEVNNQLLEAAAWLNRFQTLWELRED